ncbi:MAG: hypothetical protein GQ558_02230, partial [Thermoplasmata archaeon]|nr:hypothetical protein [Thermoplasmata archaeon]
MLYTESGIAGPTQPENRRLNQMTGPSGVKDRRGSSDKDGRSDRRRGSVAEGSPSATKEGLKQVRKYLWQRKYTIMYLAILIILSFAVRSVWYYPAAFTGGPTPLLSGNDPDYHKRTVDFFLDNKEFLRWDPLLNYPIGGPNPNPPAYSTSVALIGLAISPFYATLGDAAWLSMQIGACLWAALTVIPVYLFTKEMFGRKSAYLAALFIAFMAGNVERTPLGFSDHDAFFMFFIVVGFFFMLKSLRLVKTRVYVKSWSEPRDITIGLTEFVRSNRIALLYSVMAGFTLGAMALSWKGFPYALAIIFVYLLFHMLVNKFRRIDNTSIGLTVLVTVSILMLVSLPYYMSMNFMNWYEAPAILFAATCLIVAIFLFTRDLPWLLVLPIFLLILVVALTFVWFLLPDVWVNVVSGAGYFIRTKLYGTIAEAQPPDFNRLVFAYGMTTFFLALVGVVIMIKDIPKGWKNDAIFTSIWALVSMYMAIAAIRFMYNATPVFAILSGWITWRIVERLDYKRMIRVFRSMKGDFFKAIKYSVKLSHVAGALFMVVLIIAPNIWYSVDAGIPYETKKEKDLGIYNWLPEWLRPSEELFDPDSNSLWYLGSFGTSFMSEYWAEGMWWLAEQDTWVPDDERPGFISWWDYGHWCVNVGEHPTAADNFQNGVEFAGNFIGAGGEEEANALMLVRLFQTNMRNDTVVEYMRAEIGDLATNELIDLYRNPGKYTHLIHDYPERYGLKDDDISGRNTIYIHGSWVMMEATDSAQRVNMLLWYGNAVGDQFRYFAVDSRLMPTSYQNTGIFYAPITLSDSRVEDYIEIVAIYNGNQITLEQAAELPASERANLQYQLVWKRPFFESMFYRTFIGYSGYDMGPDFTDNGIPYVTGDLAQFPPQYAWNQTHWAAVSHTVHWNPYDAENISKHQRDWEVVSWDEGVARKQAEEGVVDDAIRSISQGVVYVKWYAGAWVNGTVTTETGDPVPGATITVHDGFRFIGEYMGPDYLGVPHGTTTTDENGRYSILAPFGNVTVVASNGGSMDYLTLHERNILNQTNLFISDDASMRIGEYNFTADMTVPIAYQSGILFLDSNQNGMYDEDEDDAMGNARMFLEGIQGLNTTHNLTTYANGFYEFKNALPGEYQVTVFYDGHEIENVALITLGPGDVKEEDLPVPFSEISGTITRRDGEDVEGTELLVRHLANNETVESEADAQGKYIFENLLPGNYSLEIYVPGTQPINESVTLTLAEVMTLNYTLVPIAFVEGAVFQDDNENGQPDPGEGLVNMTITYQRIGVEGIILTTVTNETGHYNTSIPKGLWTTYVNEFIDGDHLGYLGQIEVDPDDWSYSMNLSVTPSYLVNGTVMRQASDTNETLIPSGRTLVEIWNDDGLINVLANSSAVFGIHLPVGEYSLMTSKVIGERPRVYLTHINVTEDMDLGEIELTNGTRLLGHVYFDKNGNNAVGPDEGVSNANIIFEADGYRFNTTTISNGSYEITVAPFNYTISIDVDAYEPYSSYINASGNVMPTKKNFPLQPYNVTYSGIAGYDWDDDGNLTGDGFPFLNISFVAVDPPTNPNAQSINVTTDAEGYYETEMAPGKYRIKVKLDQDEDLGSFRYTYDEVINVKPTTDEQTKNVWLERKVRFNGTVVLDGNNTTVHTTIRVDEGAQRIDVTRGEFDDYVNVGEHLLTATYFTTSGGTTDTRYELEMIYDFDRPTTMEIVMYPVVKFTGVLYYDWNENDEFDPDDPEDEGEAVHVPRFTLQGIKDHEVYPFVNGTFESSLYPYDNYTLFLQQRDFDEATGTEYQWYKNITVNISTDTYMEVSLDRRLEFNGRVFWDRDGDDAPSGGEAIENATVSIVAEDGSVSYELTTDSNGRYNQFVQVDTEGNGTYLVSVAAPGYTPNQTEWEHTVAAHNRTLDLEMSALNVTFNGTTFLDQNMNGEMNRYEFPIPVENIELWDSENRSIYYQASTDENGSFQVSVEPGTYDVYAWTEIDGGYLVHLGEHEVVPENETQDVFLPLTIGRRGSGIMFFYNFTEVNHTVPQVNLTFVQRDGQGEVPILPASGGTFFAVLPEGRYGVNGSFETEEFGVQMTYELDDDFRMVLSDISDAELNFTRVSEYKLDMWWEDLPIYIDINSSYNLTVIAKNTGSENGTFDISADVPNDWLWSAEVDNVTLNMSETTSFWLLINSSQNAAAGPSDVILQAFPREGDDDPSELTIVVTINQFYGFEIRDPDQQTGFYRWERLEDGGTKRMITYFFTAENFGNGEESLKITHSNIQNWTIVIPENRIDLFPYETKAAVPIEVEIPDKAELKPQILTITAESLNDPSQAPDILELE